jgi:phage terminase large subunit-like protein
LILEIQTPRAFAPFLNPKRYKAAYGGRGSGKSHFFAEEIVDVAVRRKGLRAVCVREVQKSLKESAKRLIEDKITRHGVWPLFGGKPRNDHIITPGGGVILFQGMQDHTAESIKSLEGFDVAWVEEAQTLSELSLEFLRPTIRKPGSELWFSWNPRSALDAVDQFFRGLRPPDNAVIQKVNFDANPFFPAELETERRHDKQAKRDRYAHIWLGEYEPMAIGAIWDRQTIHANRRREQPELKRIVVAVDPAVSAEIGSDEHGIVAAGIGEDQRGYVLDDTSMKGSPRQWAERAIATFDKWSADAIVVERNQGGDMVKHTLKNVRPDLPVIEVVATRGKHVRAEPIAALYSMGRISHVGTFDKLEDQMCQMTAGGYEGNGSPDRCDALVWAITELMPSIVRKDQPNWTIGEVAHPGAATGERWMIG